MKPDNELLGSFLHPREGKLLVWWLWFACLGAAILVIVFVGLSQWSANQVNEAKQDLEKHGPNTIGGIWAKWTIERRNVGIVSFKGMAVVSGLFSVALLVAALLQLHQERMLKRIRDHLNRREGVEELERIFKQSAQQASRPQAAAENTSASGG